MGGALRLLVLALVVLSTLAGAAPAALAAKVGFGDEAAEKLQEALQRASPETRQCIACHLQYTPGIVYDWLRSKHAWATPDAAARLYERLGAPEWGERLDPKFRGYGYTVGCYECHGMFKEADRPDAFNHFGFRIVTIVTRKDCSQCHPKESAELSWTWHAMGSIMSPFVPWYRAILSWAKKQGADPFGDERARELYERYFPPYLTRQRGVDDIYWDFYKEIAKALREYFETGRENEIVRIIKQATKEALGYELLTPYDYDWKTFIAPLWPVSGVLNTTVLARLGIRVTVSALGQETATVSNIMEHPWFRNGHIYHACFQCHGSIVIPYREETVQVRGLTVTRVALWGWPNNGAARMDPDGSMGACTACHPRHQFSVKQAREPWTCGQCHLGYDHPHIEIYEESKHGNIWDAYGHEWNWTAIPWRVGVDFNAPTCATCHMSTLADAQGRILVQGTHDLTRRLVWDQMHMFAIPKPRIPDKVQLALYYGWSQLKGKFEEIEQKVNPRAPEEYRYPVFTGLRVVEGPEPGEPGFPRLLAIEYTGELKQHREEMKAVCNLCHSSQWTDNYFRTADQNMIDYDIVARFAFSLLQLAYREGIHDPTNPLDEYMELMWYYIWHHDGRRWRNGVYMMGPDYAYWYGIVDTVMDKLGRMISYLETALKIKAVRAELEALKQAVKGVPYAPELYAMIQQLQEQLRALEEKLRALEAQVPALRSALESLEAGYEVLSGEVEAVRGDVSQLVQQLKELSAALERIKPEVAAEFQQRIAEIEQLVARLEEMSRRVGEKAEEASSLAREAFAGIEEVSGRLEELGKRLEGALAAAYVVAGIALAAAVVGIVLLFVLRRQG